MWEVFTTKPWYDKGELKYLDTVSTPWQAFKITASKTFLSKHPDAVKNVVEIIHELVVKFKANKNDESIHATMKHMKYSEQDVRNWFKGVRYGDCRTISKQDMEKCVSVLHQAGVISQSSLDWTNSQEGALHAADLMDLNTIKVVNGEYKTF
jgi:hypothetical protein